MNIIMIIEEMTAARLKEMFKADTVLIMPGNAEPVGVETLVNAGATMVLARVDWALYLVHVNKELTGAIRIEVYILSSVNQYDLIESAIARGLRGC
jgi:hypothetical protein